MFCQYYDKMSSPFPQYFEMWNKNVNSFSTVSVTFITEEFLLMISMRLMFISIISTNPAWVRNSLSFSANDSA